jgi:trimethyllysine dioxygenase
MFHLLSHTGGGGGASLLVDGFHCASLLQKADSRAYRILCDVPVQWHASGNEGIVITPARRFPVLNLNPEADDGELLQVRWNNDDRATMLLDPAPGVTAEEWYEAARLWSEIVRDERNEYWEQLMPGRPLSMYLTFNHHPVSPFYLSFFSVK